MISMRYDMVAAPAADRCPLRAAPAGRSDAGCVSGPLTLWGTRVTAWEEGGAEHDQARG